jgi:hypothetical protein
MCRFCKSPFQHDIEQICPDCRTTVKDMIVKDPDLVKAILRDNFSFIETLMKDENIIAKFLETMMDNEKAQVLIAKQIINLPAKTIGLGGAGTIADYFPSSLSAKTSR